MQPPRRRFTFGPCLGRGSFGEVYAAKMRSPGGLDTQVAVKLLRADIDLHGSALRRLRDEGRLLARLRHPAILTVIDLVTLRGRVALVTELVDGADLAACLGAIPGRPLAQALGQVAAALAAAAQAEGPSGPLQLVHRDIKPSNIRLDPHGQVKLLDFGIARFDASDREVRTASDLIVGSVPYMAPERFIQRRVDPSSDVFSLGCCLYEGLTGDRFYGTRKVARISGLAVHPERYPAFLAARLARVDSAFHAPLEALLAITPEDRPTAAQATELLEALGDELDGPTLRAWCQAHPFPPLAPLDGPLEGQTLDEGAEEPPPVPLAAEGAPQIHYAPIATVDAAPLPPPDQVSTVEEAAPTTQTTAPLGALDLSALPTVVRPMPAASSELSDLRPVTVTPTTALAPAPAPRASAPHRGRRVLAIAGLTGTLGLGVALIGVGALGAAALLLWWIVQGR